MRIAFLLRDHYVPFYLEISRGLEKRGISTHWITNNRGWRRYMLDHGIHEDRLTFIPTCLDGNPDSEGLKVLQDLEERFPEFTVSKWILSDRALCGIPYERAKAMLGAFAAQVRRALITNGVDAVVGELTFSIELLAYYLARELGITFLYPDSVKIPSDRFAFFETPAYGDEFMRAEPTPEHLAQALAIYERWKASREKPHFWHVNLRRPVVDLKWPIKVLQWHGETDYISANVSVLAKRKTQELLNRFYVRVMVSFRGLADLDPSMRYAIFPLHKQPEASVDVTAPEFSDQYATIRNIARSLPSNHYLLVKEHPLAIGSRGRDFYRRIMEIPNVILLDPYADSYRAIEASDLVLAICSTMGYEAALIGKPVIVFSKVFYKSCPNVRYCSDVTCLAEEIKMALACTRGRFDDMIRFIGRVIANSYPGFRGHPNIDPKVMQQKNIDDWVEAFSDFAISRLRR